MFDLDKATSDWLGELRRTGSYHESDLEGLRDRLKSEMRQLMDQGLSAREASLVGRSRVTPGHGLPEQYAKAGTRQVWIDRFRWIGAGVLAYLLFNGVVWLLSLAGTALAASAGITGNALLATSAFLQILCTCGAFVVVLYVLPNMRSLGIASGYERIRRSRVGTVVLYVICAGLAGVLTLVTLTSWEELLYRSGVFREETQSLIDAYSETMAAHYMVLSLVLAVALVSILFFLSGRKRREPRVRAQR